MLLWLLACLGTKKINKKMYVWKAPLEQKHTLVGKIWSTKKQKWVSYSEMVHALQSKKHVFIGEKHDNPDHHYWQSKVLDSIHEGRVVAFEMLNVEQSNIASVQNSEAFAQAVSWSDSGWPKFSIYAPIFDVVFAYALPIVFAHPARADIMRVMQKGASEQEEVLMGAGRPLSDTSMVELREEIVASHCGHAPDAMVEMMVQAQQYKDAFMAKQIQEANQKSVLIAGTGHTRATKGMPRFFSSDDISVVHLIEVEPAKQDIGSYQQNSDYVIFTPRMTNDDPCDIFREQLEKMKR